MSDSESRDPDARMRRAQEWIEEGSPAEALEEYLWCFDHGLEHVPAFGGVRLSFLLAYIVDLAEVYPPALDALKTRRDRTERTLLEGRGIPQDAADLASLNEHLGEGRRTLDVFDRLGPESTKLREMMFNHLFVLLWEARRYADLLDASGSWQKRIENDLGNLETTRAMVQGTLPVPLPPDLDPEEIREMISEEAPDLIANQVAHVIERGGMFLEALLGTSRIEEAKRLADRLIRFSPTADTFTRLIGHARRSGDAPFARELLVRAKAELADEELEDLEDVEPD